MTLEEGTVARAPINGETLRWARLVAHIDPEALGKAVGTSAQRIAEFEAETSTPTFRQLSLLANRLDRPLGFFFAPAPAHSDVPVTADFRGLSVEDLPADITREMKRAEQHRDAMLDLTDREASPWSLDVITRETAAFEASSLRAQFGLTDRFTPPESQQNQVFNFWRGLLEAHGFLIFQTTKVPLETFRGLSIHHDLLPVVVLNGADSANGRVFTLFHEVAHLANRTSGLCALDDNVNEEAIANAFAANFLMPEALVRLHLLRTKDAVEHASHLAGMLKVSPLAAGVRLRTLALITEQDLADVRDNSTDTWRAAREAQRAADGFVPPWRLRYRDLGPNYIGAIAHALEDRRIDAVDATYLLNARLPMVEQLLAEYYRTGGAE